MSRLGTMDRVSTPVTGLPQLSDLDDQALRAHYAPLRVPWFRLNFVATTDGAAQGPDGSSESINNPADKRVFHLLRSLADVIIAGAGTVRDERYRPNPTTVCVVSRSGAVPPTLLEPGGGQVLMATCGRAPHLEETRSLLGADNVLILGRVRPRPADDAPRAGGPWVPRPPLRGRPAPGPGPAGGEGRRRALPDHRPATDRGGPPADHRRAARSTSRCGSTRCSRTTARSCWSAAAPVPTPVFRVGH